MHGSAGKYVLFFRTRFIYKAHSDMTLQFPARYVSFIKRRLFWQYTFLLQSVYLLSAGLSGNALFIYQAQGYRAMHFSARRVHFVGVLTELPLYFSARRCFIIRMYVLYLLYLLTIEISGNDI